MIKAVIFDVGGVLKRETNSAILQDVMQTLGISPAAFEEPWRVLCSELGRGLIPEHRFWELFREATGAKLPMPKESLLMREYKKGHHINQDVMSIVARLRAANYLTAVLSNTVSCHASFNRKHGLYDGFDTVVLSNEVELRKPSPQIFTLTLDKLNVSAPQAVLIDDLQKNFDGAQQMGMNSILFTDAVQLEQQLKALDLEF